MFRIKNIPVGNQRIQQINDTCAVRNERYMVYRQMLQEKRHQLKPDCDSRLARDWCWATHSGSGSELVLRCMKKGGGGWTIYRSTTTTRTPNFSAIACIYTAMYLEPNMPGMNRKVGTFSIVVSGRFPMSAYVIGRSPWVAVWGRMKRLWKCRWDMYSAAIVRGFFAGIVDGIFTASCVILYGCDMAIGAMYMGCLMKHMKVSL